MNKAGAAANCNCNTLEGFSGPYDIKKAYSIYISLLLFFILFIDFIIMNDRTESGQKKSEYSKVWVNSTLFLCVFLVIYIMLLIIDYYSLYNFVLNFDILKLLIKFKRYIFIVISLYLLIFGYYTLIEDETNKTNVSINIGAITKINNDDISIYSILIGFIVCFISVIEVISHF